LTRAIYWIIGGEVCRFEASPAEEVARAWRIGYGGPWVEGLAMSNGEECGDGDEAVPGLVPWIFAEAGRAA